MTVGIIIPVYNGEATIRQCIEACLNQDRPADDIVVVDDGSTDHTASIVSELPVTYVRQNNAGPAAARNRGARATTADILVYTDSDCVPRANWLAMLLAPFEESDDIVAAGGSYGMANPKSRLARMIHAEIQVRHARFKEDVDFLGSFNVAYRRSAFEAVGGFDESFKAASGEDNDLAYRLLANRGRLRFVADALVDHYHPTNVFRYWKTQKKHGYWRMKLYAKQPGRATGDQYAPLSDLLGPPAALLALALLPLFIITGVSAFMWSFYLLFGVLFLSHIPMVTAMIRATGQQEHWLYWPVLVVRDFERGAGLLWGFWRFQILRKDN